MNLLPFGELPPHVPRRFVPHGTDLGVWSQVEPLFTALEDRAPLCQSAPALEDWLLDYGELNAALEEEASRRYIAMTCHTDNADAEKAFLDFVERIEPQAKPRLFRLERLYLDHPRCPELSPERYGVLERNTRARVEIFREQNVPLETEETKLGQQYQKVSGSLTVRFRGEERTLVQMGRYQEEPDRALRQETWELVAHRRLQEAETFDRLFEQMLQLRKQMAANAGFPDYRAYAFRARARFDYTPADCLTFHDAIAQWVVPLLRELRRERRRQLGVPALRPWDLAADPLGRPPLKPFDTVEQMVTRAQGIFGQLDAELAAGFRTLRDSRLLDLENRKGKAPGGYQQTLAESRLPFIFMNAVGLQRDVETLLHEAGHAFHALAVRDEPLHAYRNPPIEFCEVASMSMELLGNEFIETFYSDADARRARRKHLEGIVEVLPWIATVDAFQHWLYTHPGHTRLERSAAWVALMGRFGGEVDWAGHEAALASLWHRQLHIFLHPFYYVEYGIAQLGALQLWANWRRDRVQGLEQYKRALGLGGAKPLPELFQAAGCRFDFTAATLGPLLELVQRDLAKLG